MGGGGADVDKKGLGIAARKANTSREAQQPNGGLPPCKNVLIGSDTSAVSEGQPSTRFCHVRLSERNRNIPKTIKNIHAVQLIEKTTVGGDSTQFAGSEVR